MNEDTRFLFVWFPMGILFFLLVIFMCHLIENKPKSMGYGGSPGHMSPMEIEELHQKSKVK